MKKLLLLFGVLVAIASIEYTLLMQDKDTLGLYKYDQELPLSVGNYWTYQVTRYDGFNNSNDVMTATLTMTDTITGLELKDGFFVATVQSAHSAETLARVRGNYPITDALRPAVTQTYWLILDGDRVLRQDDQLDLSDLHSRVLVEFVFPLGLDSQWSTYNAMDAPLNRKVTRTGSITVPAGTFTDCLYLQGVIGGTTFEDWFCPGIGIVWHNAEHHGTPYGNRRELVSYRTQ